MSTMRHCVQFCIPGSPWVWLASNGRGTIDPDAAHDFGSPEAAKNRAAAMQSPRSNIRAKYATMECSAARDERLCELRQVLGKHVAVCEWCAAVRRLIDKYGLTTAESKSLARHARRDEIERKLETWRAEHGMPAANSPLCRGALLSLIKGETLS